MKGEILKAMQWRYATKKFNPDKIIEEELVNEILESLRLTATSYGLQLMKVVVVEDKKVREDLVRYSFGQNQVLDASHLLVLCREKEAKFEHIEGFINDIAEIRSTEIERLEGFKNMMTNSILTKSEEWQEVWLINQVYIALGNLLTTCAMLRVDACPMEGFLSDKYDEVLELEQEGLSAVLVIPIGYRADDDKYAKVKKVRRANERFIIKK